MTPNRASRERKHASVSYFVTTSLSLGDWPVLTSDRNMRWSSNVFHYSADKYQAWPHIIWPEGTSDVRSMGRPILVDQFGRPLVGSPFMNVQAQVAPLFVRDLVADSARLIFDANVEVPSVSTNSYERPLDASSMETWQSGLPWTMLAGSTWTMSIDLRGGVMSEVEPSEILGEGVEATTTAPAKVQVLRKEISETDTAARFDAARSEHFEDGMESEFAGWLGSLVATGGKRAMDAVTAVMENADPEVAAEALHCLSRLEDPRTYRDRRWLLEASLRSLSPMVRDAAVRGLSFLQDPHAIVYLRRALRDEKIGALRADISELLRELEDEAQTKAS